LPLLHSYTYGHAFQGRNAVEKEQQKRVNTNSRGVFRKDIKPRMWNREKEAER